MSLNYESYKAINPYFRRLQDVEAWCLSCIVFCEKRVVDFEARVGEHLENAANYRRMIFLSLDFPCLQMRIIVYLDDSALLSIIISEYALIKLDVAPCGLDDATLDSTVIVKFWGEVSEIWVFQAEDTPSIGMVAVEEGIRFHVKSLGRLDEYRASEIKAARIEVWENIILMKSFFPALKERVFYFCSQSYGSGTLDLHDLSVFRKSANDLGPIND